MEVYVSNWYGIILLAWGLIFEIAGVVMFLGIYNAVKGDQRRMNVLAAEPAPPPTAPTPAQAPARQRERSPRRAA